MEKKIDQAQVRKVARLSRLDLTDAEVDEFTGQLSAILDYVDKMNGVLYNSISNGGLDQTNKKGLGTLFKTIAVQEGDFDTQNGRSRIQVFKDYIGEERLEQYKQDFPEKYNYLVEMDSRWIE